jgi:integrase
MASKTRRGEGMIWQRGRTWWIQFYVNGQRVRLSSESDDADAARQLLKEKVARVTLGEPLVVRSARVTYDELRKGLVAHYEATGSRDLDEAGWRLKHLDSAFRGVRASRITGLAITEYIVQRQRAGAANGTINREVAVLLRMLRLGLEHHKLVRLPIVHKPKEAAPRAGFFEADAFRAVRAHLPPDLQVAVTIAYTFGWRMQSEVLPLEARQLDLAAGTVRLDPGTTKNDEGRVVYLTPELRELLTAHVERVQALSRELERVVPWLFPHFAKPHRGSQRRDFRKAWKTACTDAGYPGMLRHDFRRTAVRNMVNRSIPERVAMTITGHKTRAVFDRYHIVSPADLQEASRKLAEPTSATISATVGQVRPINGKRKARAAQG